MGQMIRSKREWVCSNCSAKAIKWAGTCIQCNQVATLEEQVLIQPKPRASAAQKSIMRRSKNAERTAAKRMVDADGRDPDFDKIATSTGRVGQITNMQFDAISKTYVTEVKNRKLATWMVKAWIQIQQRAIDFHKHALLYVDAPNSPKDFTLNTVRHKSDAMAIIRQDRHEQLIRQEQIVDMANEILVSKGSDAQILYELKALFGRLNQ